MSWSIFGNFGKIHSLYVRRSLKSRKIH